MYTARSGWHYLNLSTALPPMALLKAVPAAVVTTDAERYFHVEGAPSGLKYTDSRRILALKLPCERQAHGYALQEVWSDTARQLAREASVASTVLDPISDSDEEEEITPREFARGADWSRAWSRLEPGPQTVLEPITETQDESE